jgi:hypothetical protein
MMGSAVAAQADCVTNDSSSPCHWDPSGAGNSPNVIQQSYGFFTVKPIDANATVYGWLYEGPSDWYQCTYGYGTVDKNQTLELCSDVESSTTEHVQQTSGESNYIWLYFPTT